MAAPFNPEPGPGLGGGRDALVLWAERAAHCDRRVPGRGMLRFVFYGRVPQAGRTPVPGYPNFAFGFERPFKLTDRLCSRIVGNGEKN